ncbi:putative metalloprotease CJM1_0395 family protein [Pelagicoccus mobilis]|uniref:SprA-related family protein n=1 Tax=Pelagicoccus mobilis TaxID=415221 RepID=A0A934VS84_9BACT|nr:putative metalloprotease CJM1_0395 family protein [Pelagicoccus mobilis]MBK1880177.1 hypothetical protein [Pelagicoccus mobilis]
MIGSVSSASFASYGFQQHSQGDRFASARHPHSDEPEEEAFKSAKAKEEEERNQGPNQLDPAEKEQVEKLKKRDAEVRAHEQAHMAAAGSLAMGGPTYVFQTGPDGKQYAVGGNVKIDTSPGRTPEETAQKAKQIRAAALAPSEPSAQDMKVAAAAASMEMEASAKLNDKASEKGSPSNSGNASLSGEITSARQVFAAAASDQQNAKDSENGNEQKEPNSLVLQAAQLYSKQTRNQS